MGAKALINCHPKTPNGSKGARRCRVCGNNLYFAFEKLNVTIANQKAIIRKHHLDICRQCFRERANDIGFVKVIIYVGLI